MEAWVIIALQLILYCLPFTVIVKLGVGEFVGACVIGGYLRDYAQNEYCRTNT